MKGIAVAGTLLVDKLNIISAYPNEGELTQIKDVALAVGGLVPNVGIDLKKLSPDLDVFAVGKTGKDADGEYITNVLTKNGLDVSNVLQVEGLTTDFTNVMSIPGGTRTFFTYSGAGKTFGVDDIDFENLKVKMLHLGYFLLLDKIDNGDGEKILKLAQEKGIKTSIDLVSENSDRYKQVVPCLKYTDNLIINEVEAGNITGIEPILENMSKICQSLLDLGVKERVIIHAPSFGVCMSKDGFTIVPSYDIPSSFIKGTTGAGDAFCAGALTGIYNGYSDKEILEFSSAVAVTALSTVDATSGIKTVDDVKEFCKQFNRRELCL